MSAFGMNGEDSFSSEKCPYCGSTRIERGIQWGKSADAGYIGLDYKKGMLVGVSQAYSDLCLDCGTLLRTYITDATDKNWVK